MHRRNETNRTGHASGEVAMDNSVTQRVIVHTQTLIAQGWSCAEAMVIALGQALDLAHPDDPAEATPFCGGIGRSGRLCGAIAGGLIIIGRVAGRRPTADGGPSGSGSACRALSRRLAAAFERQAAATNCRDITGLQLSDPGQLRDFVARGLMRQVCLPLVTVAIRETLTLIGNHREDGTGSGRGGGHSAETMVTSTRGGSDS